jgi:glucose-6-phosphate 1-dehydrogenase
MSAIILFGATGDLARRMLLPSLFGLHADGLLPPDLRIVGTARSPLDEAAFRTLAADAIAASPGLDPAPLPAFLDRVAYVPLDATDREGFHALSEAVATEGPVHIFLSTAPSLFAPTISGLAGAGLAGANVRLALEKPLGSDLASSRAINDAVANAFPEERIFRIDHYLGKETVQNLLALRFANTLFEPLWRADAIAHVEITVAETVGLEGRGDTYDGAGALRDMVQNHMLQLLALVAMEPPARLSADAVRSEKVKILSSLRPIGAAEVEQLTVRGQYEAGAVAGQPVPGYAEELARPSTTETFVALKAHIDNWRWKGVPFYLRTGKRLQRRKSEIVIAFRPVPHSIFGEAPRGMKANRLLIGLQPEETIRLSLMAKVPGLDREGMRLREVALDLGDRAAFAEHRRRIAYERLLLDLVEGRPTLFVRRDEVEAQWAFIDAIRAGWSETGQPTRPYTAGSWGPSEAFALVGRDGVAWND